MTDRSASPLCASGASTSQGLKPAARFPAHRAGVLFMVLGIFLFAMNDTVAKWLMGSFGLGQVLLVRTVACVLILAPLYARTGFAPLRQAQRPWLQLLRAAFSAMEVALFYAAVIWLPLADAITFYMAGPIYVAVMATFLLGEKSDWMRWLAILAGFIGVIVALDPTGASFSWPALIALSGSMLFAGSMIITRYLRGTPDLVLVTGSTMGSAVLGALLLPFGGWTPPSAVDVGLMAGLGVVALAGHACVNRSLKLAPATTVVPYQYLLIVWGIVLGYLVFGDTPRISALVGAVIIVAAGVVVFLREHYLNANVEPDDLPLP